MIELLLEPLSYAYMSRAIWTSALVGGTCAFLSAYLIMKGWSLMGDALAHAIVPGVALAYLFSLPYAFGAFIAGLLAALSMQAVKHQTKLREDAIIGFIFTTFFAIGLLLVSINPMAVNLQGIILGNILAISDSELSQVIWICSITLALLIVFWKDLMHVFFDEVHAKTLGLPVGRLKIMFFTLLSASCVAALQSVGACLVIAMVITPGATAFLLTDRFPRLVTLAVLMGALTSATGAYLSFFLDVNPGGLIVVFQTLLFVVAWIGAPKYGLFARRKAQRMNHDLA